MRAVACTPEHPFYAEGKGFVEAKALGIGTSIVTRAGPAVQVANVERHNAPATVYNFVVKDTHTYFVGTANGGVWVHNQCAIFAVTRDGTAIPTSATELDQGFTNAGFAARSARGNGTIYSDPRPGVNLEYRVMRGPDRLITHSVPGGNPMMPGGGNLPGNLGKSATRDLIHFPLNP